MIAGEVIWASDHFDVAVLCLLWVCLDEEQEAPGLLLSGGGDKRVRVWKKEEEGEEGMLGGLKMWGMFGVQPGVILALAQNSTCLATASGESV